MFTPKSLLNFWQQSSSKEKELPSLESTLDGLLNALLKRQDPKAEQSILDLVERNAKVLDLLEQKASTGNKTAQKVFLNWQTDYRHKADGLSNKGIA